MALPFHLLDVFTTGTPMTGNQLLVVVDRSDSLTTEDMLAIAKEINLAESAFVRSSDVRIFTTDEEVPQAGHPVLGLAEVIAGSSDESGTSTVELLTKKGPISVTRDPAGRWVMSQDPAQWLGNVSSLALEPIVQGSIDAFIGDSFPIGSTCGLPYVLVPVASEESLAGLRLNCDVPPPADWSIYFYCRCGEAALRARMFCFEGGRWLEDTATGSAAGPLAAHLAPITACVTQGLDRRAHLHISAASRDSRVEVGGTVVRVAQGQWFART